MSVHTGNKHPLAVAFGKRLKDVIKRHNLSQSKVARQIGTPEEMVNRWCAGERSPSHRNLVSLLGALSVFELDALWFVTGHKSKTPRTHATSTVSRFRVIRVANTEVAYACERITEALDHLRGLGHTVSSDDTGIVAVDEAGEVVFRVVEVSD